MPSGSLGESLEDAQHRGHVQPAADINWDNATTFRHVNGVTVYQQQEPDSKIATYMVSASVHATPEACLKVRPLAYASWL